LEEYKENVFSPKKGKNYNPQAPATLAELRDQDNRDYIKKYAEIAVKEMHRTGVPASISMSQALIESRAGHSNLAKKSNNHFGIKCFSKSCAPGHCQNFSDDHHKDFFRNFKTPEESWKAHSELLQRPHYQSLAKNGSDNYKAWARGLKQKGYATAGHYDKTLISIIERYDLHKLDKY
jgi:flagellum-specific peptidoglycan hydrolase FlgJ